MDHRHPIDARRTFSGRRLNPTAQAVVIRPGDLPEAAILPKGCANAPPV